MSGGLAGFGALGLPSIPGLPDAGYYPLSEVGDLDACAEKCGANARCKGFNWVTSDFHATRFPCQLGTAVDPAGFSGTTGCAFLKEDLAVVDCEVSGGWEWGACSSECGEGASARTRSVLVLPRNGGRPCPALSQTVPCMNRVCDCRKVACKYQTHRCLRNLHFYEATNIVSGYRHAGVTGMGAGDEHGGAVRHDAHDGALICDASESVKVFHDHGENGCVTGDESCVGTGHHCRLSGGGRAQLHGKVSLAGGDVQLGEGAAPTHSVHTRVGTS